VVLDPDNGIGEETRKHATFSEVRLLRKPGRAIVFITFRGRKMTHDALLQELHEQLMAETLSPCEPASSYRVLVGHAPMYRASAGSPLWMPTSD
jgi:hypothetical protein